MYTITHYQGRDMPLDRELFESYTGEAREIIFQSFIEEGMILESVYTIDDISQDDIELEVSEWLTTDEIGQLKEIEKYAPESFWDALTVPNLSDALKTPKNEREVA